MSYTNYFSNMELTIKNKKLILVTGDIFKMRDKIEQLILTVSGGYMASQIHWYSRGNCSTQIEEYKLEDIPGEVTKMLDLASANGLRSVGMNAARTTGGKEANYMGQGVMIKACLEWLEKNQTSSLEKIYLVDLNPNRNFETAYNDFVKGN